MNVLQVLISVKSQGDSAISRVQGAITSFTSGIQNRVAAVQAFNAQISNGEAALRKWAAIAVAAFSTNALRNYMKEAEEADRVQRKLLQALQRMNELKSQDVLEQQQAALQRVTRAKDDEIATIQRLLLTNGLSVQQTLQMTEVTLDFAEATGQSFESAGALIARTLRDSGEEIGRFNIRLDQTKPRYDALQSALTKYAAGQARAAIVDKQAHAAQVDLGEAGERIGRALNTMVGPVLSALVPAFEALASGATKLAAVLRPMADQIATLVKWGTVAATAFFGLKGAISVILGVVNPLRAGFVALAGVNFSTINQFTRDLGFMQTMQLATWGQRGAAGLSLIGAAIAGWEIGSMVKELEFEGLKIEDWLARMINVWFGWADELGAAAKTAWVFFKFNFLEKLTEGRIALLEFVEFIGEKLNKVLPKKMQIPVDSVRDAIADYRKELRQLGVDEGNAFSEIERSITQKRAINAAVDEDLDTNGRKEVAARKAPAAAIPPAPPLSVGGAETDSVELQQRRLIFELETKILQARAAGRQAQATELQATLDEINMLMQLGGDQGALVNARIAASKKLQDQERSRTEEERVMGEKLGSLARQRAVIEADRYRTEAEKQAAILPLLKEENELITARIALLERELLMGATDERRGQIQQQLEQLRGQQAGNAGDQKAAEPQGIFGGMLEGMVSWMNEIGTLASQVGATMKSTIGAAVDSISRGIYGLLTRTKSWRDALTEVGQAVLGTLIQAIIQMGVRWVATQLMMAIAGKTIAAAQTAASVPIAMAQSAIWATPATLATIASFGGAALQAPLSIAGALGATQGMVALAGAAGLKEGGMTAKGPRDKPVDIVHAGEWVAPAWMLEHPVIGPMIYMLEAVRSGAQGFMEGGLVMASGASSLRSRIDLGMASPYQPEHDAELQAMPEPQRVPNVTVVNVQDEVKAQRIARQGAAVGDIVYIFRNNKHLFTSVGQGVPA